jgi:ankyrin repeat protein
MAKLDSLIEAAKQGDLAGIASILDSHPEIINQRDARGATALHYAAFSGHRAAVQELVQRGADVNAKDAKFGATPAGWAIEYLREMGGFLGIELEDFGYAIRKGETEWVARFLRRFPALRGAKDNQGQPFRMLAQQSGNPAIAQLFEPAR